MLCSVAILLLDGEAVDIISVHDLFNSFVVVKNGEAWHFVKFFQMAVKTVTTLDEIVSSVHQCISLHTCILHSASHPLTVSFLCPIWALVVVKGLRAHKLTMKDLGFIIDVILNLSLMCHIEIILAYGKVIILDFILGLSFVYRYEILFVNLA